MKKVSAVLITRNEEHNIREALESVLWADELIVVDAMSTDRTAEIARQLTPRVIQRDWPGYVEQKNFAAGQATHAWIFSLDADERVSGPLRQEIEQWRRAEDESVKGFLIPRAAFFLGRWIRHTTWYPDEKLRLYHRDYGRWGGGRVHESVHLSVPPGRCRGELLHYSYRGLSDYIRRLELYSALAARDLEERGARAGLLSLTAHPFFAFVKNYLFKQGFREGIPGLVVSILASISVFFKYAKLWELQNKSKER